jgi:hypothetical protein
MLQWAILPLPSSDGGGAIMDDVQNALGYDSVYGQNATDLAVQVWPAFRTVLAGQTASAWVYIKNTGTGTAQNVQIRNATSYSPQPVFNYQNPAGQWNTPYNIPAGQTATFAVFMPQSTADPHSVAARLLWHQRCSARL